jgi:hypothetical protein
MVTDVLQWVVKSRLSTVDSFIRRSSKTLDLKPCRMSRSKKSRGVGAVLPRFKGQMCSLAPFNAPTFRRSACRRFLLTSLERTLTKNPPVSPVDLTLTKSLDLNCPRITLLRKKAGARPLFHASADLCRPMTDDCLLLTVDAPTDDCLLMTVDSPSLRRRDCPSPDHCVSIRHFGGSLSRNLSALRSSHEAAGTLPLGRIRRDPSRSAVPAARGYV